MGYTKLLRRNYPEQLLQIIERALRSLPHTDDNREIVRKTYASFFSRVARTCEYAQDMSRLRDHVLITLKTYPWMITDPSARSSIAEKAGKVAATLGLQTDSPVAIVQAFCAEVRTAVGGRRLSERWGVRLLLACVWLAVGEALVETRLPQFRWPSAFATAYAVHYNPALIRQKNVWKILVRGTILASSRWDPILAILKAKAR